ncbi:MAG: hypothetical protein EXR71_18540 [Myxococcales bacterium]|nr:hypothetical protein [Myxococcales bacterium]
MPTPAPPVVAPPAELPEADRKPESPLVPSPKEMEIALDKAGVAKGLSALVRERKLNMTVVDKDTVAVRTGVAIADTLLTVLDSPREKLLDRVGLIRAGMKSIGAGGNIDMTLEDLIARITNDSVSRDDLLRDLDEMHQSILPEIEFQGGERMVPLIQAGAWLEGSHLVSTAILAANKPEAGTNLLRQSVAVDYFLKYVEQAGPTRPAVGNQLEKTLRALKEISTKPTLSIDDVRQVKDETDAVLSML